MKILIEGKAKKLIITKKKQELVQYFKDSATAFNNKKLKDFKGKGIYNNHISTAIFKYINKNRIKTHFIKRINDREQLIKKVKIIPIEFVVRNFVAGSLQKKFNLEKGRKISKPILELYYKSDALNDPLINDDHVFLLNLATRKEIQKIRRISLRINELLIKYFKAINITLVDFKLEFGKLNSEILLADEVSPDNCRLIDIKSKKSLDKDLFRENKGNLTEAYKIVYNRIKRKYEDV